MEGHYNILAFASHRGGVEVSSETLAGELGMLSYVAIERYVRAFAERVERDGNADLKRGRAKLAAELDAAAKHLFLAAEAFGRAARIKPKTE